MIIHFSIKCLLGLSIIVSCILSTSPLAMDQEETLTSGKSSQRCIMPGPITNYFFAPVTSDHRIFPYEVKTSSSDFMKVFVEQYNEISGTFYVEKIDNTAVLLHEIVPGRFGVGGIFFNLYEELKDRYPNLTTIYANVLISNDKVRHSLVEGKNFEETIAHSSVYCNSDSRFYIGYKKTL